MNYPNDWFSKVSSISTAFASIGSLLLLFVTFQYLLETKKMVQEMQLQREPAVTVKIIPDKDNFNLLNLLIKNTGGGPAYDITIHFDPDLPYQFSDAKTLNNLDSLRLLPLLEKK